MKLFKAPLLFGAFFILPFLPTNSYAVPGFVNGSTNSCIMPGFGWCNCGQGSCSCSGSGEGDACHWGSNTGVVSSTITAEEILKQMERSSDPKCSAPKK